jgi:hypothetical protein
VAFLPMQLTVTSAVNNDALAGAIAAAITYVAVRLAAPPRLGAYKGDRLTLAAGGLLGIAFLTKATLYPLALVVTAAKLLAPTHPPAPLASGDGSSRRSPSAAEAARRLRAAAVPLALGLLVAAPWFIRNAAVYGGLDVLGLGAHDAVVRGDQPRTLEMVRDMGLTPFTRRLVVWTFDSFWGVFGWMGVFMPTWAYAALGLASAGAAAGWLVVWRRARRGEHPEPLPSPRLVVLVTAIAITLSAYLAYNLSFVQHQGRYLFPALVPIALLFMQGIAELAAWLTRRLPTGVARLTPAASMAAFAAALAGLAAFSLHWLVIPWLSP